MIDFDRVKGSVDLREVVLRYTTLDRGGHGPCPLCGGSDRFYIHKGGDRCGCRGCNFQGDVIELVHKVEGVNRAEAAKMLGGKQLPGGDHERGRSSRIIPALKKEPEPSAWLDEAWQTRARQIVERAEARLIDSPGAAYFEGRGITLETCKRFRLGYVPNHLGRPVVAIPWFDDLGNITAVKYRYLKAWTNEQGKPQRYTAEKGSTALLFGLIGCKGSDTLVVVEGEINALSLAQSVPFDVVSIGSEQNSKGLDALTELVKVKGYSRLLFWFDKSKNAEEAAELFPGSAAMKSADGEDAADLLKEYGGGALVELVELMLSKQYGGHKERGVSKDLPGTQNASAAAQTLRIGTSAPIVPDRDELNRMYEALGPRSRSCPVRRLYLDVDMRLIKGEPLNPLHERMIELLEVDQRNGTRWVLDLVEYLYPEPDKTGQGTDQNGP